MFAAYCQEYPEMDKLWNQYFDEKQLRKLWEDEDFWKQVRKAGSNPQKSFWKDIKLYEGQLP